jgi:hypothetical protein
MNLSKGRDTVRWWLRSRRWRGRTRSNDHHFARTAAEGRREPDDVSIFVINPAQPGQSYTSVCSANSKASSTSIPRTFGLVETRGIFPPWNKGKLVGQKALLKLKEIWAVRVRLQVFRRTRELALFDLGIDSKLRA